MNRRQKKKWENNHVTLIDRHTGKKSTISIENFKRLIEIAGLSKEEFQQWCERSMREE